MRRTLNQSVSSGLDACRDEEYRHGEWADAGGPSSGCARYAYRHAACLRPLSQRSLCWATRRHRRILMIGDSTALRLYRALLSMPALNRSDEMIGRCGDDASFAKAGRLEGAANRHLKTLDRCACSRVLAVKIHAGGLKRHSSAPSACQTTPRFCGDWFGRGMRRCPS